MTVRVANHRSFRRHRTGVYPKHPLMIHLDKIIDNDGRTQTELAKISGINQRTISTWTSGRRVPNGIVNLIALLNTMDYDLVIVERGTNGQAG